MENDTNNQAQPAPRVSAQAEEISTVDLKAIGGFTPATGYLKELSWTNTETDETHNFNVYVQKTSFGRYAKLLKQGEDADVPGAYLLVNCLFRDKACRKPLLTYDQVLALDPGLSGVFFQAVREVNEGQGKGQGSTQKKSSATS